MRLAGDQNGRPEVHAVQSGNHVLQHLRWIHCLQPVDLHHLPQLVLQQHKCGTSVTAHACLHLPQTPCAQASAASLQAHTCFHATICSNALQACQQKEVPSWQQVACGVCTP